MITSYIALGGNLEDPIATFCQFLADIDARTDIICSKRSSLYKSAAMGYTDQPDFVNAVIQVETRLSGIDLIEYLLSEEKQYGRVRQFENGPRTLDLDVLLYGESIISDARLTVPHPRMLQRAFVLLPLMEIAPDLILPTGEQIAQFLDLADGQEIIKIVDPRW